MSFKLTITVRGGVVQEVYSDGLPEDTEVEIVDLDDLNEEGLSGDYLNIVMSGKTCGLEQIY